MGKEVTVKKEAQLAPMDELKAMFAQFNQSAETQAMSEQIKADTIKYQFFGEATPLGVSKDQQVIAFKDPKDGNPASTLIGTILKWDKNNEYRPDQESKIPLCSSKGGENGTLYGKCSECVLGTYREGIKGCTKAYKILVAILGEPTLDRKGNILDIQRKEEFAEKAYEIGISRSSWSHLKEYLSSVRKEKPTTQLGREPLPIDLLTIFRVSTDDVNGKKVNVLTFETDSILVDDAFGGDVEKMEFLKRAMLLSKDPKYALEPTPYKAPQADPRSNDRIREVTEADIEDASVLPAAKPVAAIADAKPVKGNIVDVSEEDTPF